ncbi:hypothetical protein [Flavobacterium coralii]|uniref:hypothetical protein n=1 Tax=Flavobacterium coralii TaxID=2838017 RepID=UPI000C674CE8|nr:hypothetical protein [Flavobacterium sp.]|tara:strand:+ start:71818 stop:72267 length:450 start_codon:yes stop_codon:yes gene_type:complete
MDFTKMDISTVAHGKGGDGVRYLRLFLQEYTSLFNQKVNPGCPKCLTQYLNRYKNHFKEMDKKPQYRLHAKYENIPLEFGSPILVNNANITPEYAQKLLQQKNGSRYFAYIPTQEELLQADEEQKLNGIPGKEPGLDDDDALDNESTAL